MSEPPGAAVALADAPPAVAPFYAVTDTGDPRAWADLATLVGPDGTASVRGVTEAPAGWEILRTGQGVQLVDTGLRAEPDPEAVRLGADDVPEILGLVARTRPGPCLPRTVEMGTYLGIRHRGRLIARLVRAVAAGIKERGERPFLHASATNADATRLYESIGFTLRRRTVFSLVRPAGAVALEETAPAVALSLSKADCSRVQAEVWDVTRVLRVRAHNPRRRVRLHSRPHIDLQRVAGALCCS